MWMAADSWADVMVGLDFSIFDFEILCLRERATKGSAKQGDAKRQELAKKDCLHNYLDLGKDWSV